MNPVQKAIRERSSTRGYAPTPLTEEELQNVIDAALAAPTAANRQELHFTVLPGDAPILQELETEKNRDRGLTETPPHNFYYEAPTVVIISGDEQNPWSPIDAGIAAENIALAAEGMGLGSLIIGCVKGALLGEKKAYFGNALHFPEGYRYFIAVAVGHKTVTKEPHTSDAEALVTRL